jgi:hypothetical protein
MVLPIGSGVGLVAATLARAGAAALGLGASGCKRDAAERVLALAVA